MNLNHINTWQEMTNKDMSVKYFKIFCLFFLPQLLCERSSMWLDESVKLTSGELLRIS